MGIPPSPPKTHTDVQTLLPMADRAINHQRALFLNRIKFDQRIAQKLEAKQARKQKKATDFMGGDHKDGKDNQQSNIAESDTQEEGKVKIRKVGDPAPASVQAPLPSVTQAASAILNQFRMPGHTGPVASDTLQHCCWVCHREFPGARQYFCRDEIKGWVRMIDQSGWACPKCWQIILNTFKSYMPK